MENQVNIGDQNTQQNEHIPTDQPIQVPETKTRKIGYWMITIIVVLSFSTIAALIWLSAGYKPKENSYLQKQTTVNTSDQISEVPKNQNKKNLIINIPTVWTMERDWLKVYIPQGSIPLNSKVAFILTPEPTYESLSNIPLKDTFQISGSSDGNQLENLQSNMVIYQPVDINNPRLSLIHKETLSYYFWDKDKSLWIPVRSSIYLDKGYALAEYNKFGAFSLRGDPVNKAPKILSVEPNKIKYNQDVVITIKGENFQSASSVNFGMGGYATEFIDSNTLQVRLENSLTPSPGNYELVIGNPDYQRAYLPKALTVEE